MDYMGRHSYPFLFGFLVYPIDVAGSIEYAVGFAVLYLSSKRGIEWVSTDTVACLAYSIIIIG